MGGMEVVELQVAGVELAEVEMSGEEPQGLGGVAGAEEVTGAEEVAGAEEVEMAEEAAGAEEVAGVEEEAGWNLHMMNGMMGQSKRSGTGTRIQILYTTCLGMVRRTQT